MSLFAHNLLGLLQLCERFTVQVKVVLLGNSVHVIDSGGVAIRCSDGFLGNH